MNAFEKKSSKTIGAGGCGKCRVYYSQKFKRKVVEKTVGESFIRTKKNNRTRFQTLMTNTTSSEILLKKESIFMILTKIAKLDCCVEILDFANNPFRIIMEYCEGGDIRKILDKYDVPDCDKMTMISQILHAVKRIHENGFIHGDLKCANIFLCNKYIPGHFESIKIKIGDFGLSEIGGDLVYGGTPGFMAPEVPLVGGSFDSDIYSVGKVMLEIMTQLPVQMIQVINSSNIFSLKYKLPRFMDITQFYDLVISCLNKDYKKRPNAKEVFLLFHKILEIWLLGEKTNDSILKQYKLGESVSVDPHYHPLVLSNGDMRNYSGGGFICDMCKRHFLNNMYSFNCKKCEYDLCYICIQKYDYKTINEQMEQRAPKGKKVYVSCHPHYLLLSGKEDRYEGKNYDWICDVCKASSSENIYSFHCKDCGYDVCSRCFEKKFIIKEDKCCCLIF